MSFTITLTPCLVKQTLKMLKAKIKYFSQNMFADEFDIDFTESEIREAIFSQKDNKSPGIDNITSESSSEIPVNSGVPQFLCFIVFTIY